MDEDARVLEALRLGDASALEALMQRFAARVFRLAFGITRNTADAEEVTQDVFLTVYRKHETFQGRAALGSWIYRITTNAALNKRRGKRAEVEVPLEPYLPTFLPDGHREGDRAYLLADWSAAPDRELLTGEARALVTRALDELPDAYRAVLLLRDVEERTNEEAAEILGESVASVKSRLHRARMALRERLTRRLAKGES